MSAGTAYSKRYGAGFVDLPSKTTPIDAQFLNAVEAALLQLLGAAPTADGQVAQWDNANTRFGPALLLNKNIDPAAAISKSKLDFTGANGIVDADVAGAAGIQRSKLNFGSGLVNADIAAAAAIAASKLAGYPSDSTKLLAGDGSWVQRGLIKKTTSKTVVNTVAPTDLLNGEITLPALGTTSTIRLTLAGDLLNNTGASQASPSFAVTIGGTSMISFAGLASILSTTATRMPWLITVTIQNLGAANSQWSSGRMALAHANPGIAGASTGGPEGYSQNIAPSGGVSLTFAENGGSAAIDTSTAKALACNVTNGVANASYETVLRHALVEVF